MKKCSFAKVLAQAPPEIEVSYEDTVTVLKPNMVDKQYADEPNFNRASVDGDGSERSPYTILHSSGLSPHYCIIFLWWMFRPTTAKSDQPRGPLFFGPLIRVNDWTLQVRYEGVVAEVTDSFQFNLIRLLPKKKGKK